MAVTLHLRERPARVDSYIMNLTPYVQGWRRTIRAIGGYWLGDFYMTSEHLHRTLLAGRFFYDLGRQIQEKTGSLISWEGEIYQMDLTVKGITFRRTLDPARWHNRVKVLYTDQSTGNPAATGWTENADSTAEYGDSEYIDTVGNDYDSTSATALRDRRLTQSAWPEAVIAEGLSQGTERYNQRFAGLDVLKVFVAGHVFSMNRRYRESDTAAANISSQVSTLVGESEFVTAGIIDTNTLQVPIKGSEIAFKLWDGIQDFIERGDASGNRWAGGVYAGRKFNYNQAATTVTRYWRKGRLLDRQQSPVTPSLAKPDVIVQVADLPFGITPPSGSVWDNARNAYIEEVEFIAPDGLRLIPYEGAQLVVEGF